MATALTASRASAPSSAAAPLSGLTADPVAASTQNNVPHVRAPSAPTPNRVEREQPLLAGEISDHAPNTLAGVNAASQTHDPVPRPAWYARDFLIGRPAFQADNPTTCACPWPCPGEYWPYLLRPWQQWPCIGRTCCCLCCLPKLIYSSTRCVICCPCICCQLPAAFPLPVTNYEMCGRINDHVLVYLFAQPFCCFYTGNNAPCSSPCP